MPEIKDWFKLEFDGGLYIIPNEYKEEVRGFLSNRTTALQYLAKRYTIDEIAEFLKTDEHCKHIMAQAQGTNRRLRQ